MGVLPEAAERVLGAALVGEFTVIDGAGRPVTHPMIPLYDDGVIYMSSSVLFSRKLEHIRANPRACLSVTDPIAVPGVPFARVTVQGDAIVRDADPHGDWERILPLWIAKEPAVKDFLSKRFALPLFFERMVIELRPRRVLVWPDGDTTTPPTVTEAARR